MLSAGWLVYALVTGTLVAGICWAADALLRAHGLPTRWTWPTGLVATLALAVRALVVSLGSPSELALPANIPTSAATHVPVATPGVVVTLLDATATMLSGALAVATRALPHWVSASAVALWIAASALLVATIVLVHLRIGRQRRTWPAAALHGHEVRIAPAAGPAVLGVVRAVIVVPRWLLARSDAEQRLVLAHESEHVRAHDHLLLSAAWLLVALVPWHPAAWWMLSRQRLAIELDCDRRVLRRGVAARVYGSLLIDLAGQCSGFTAGATALADESSHLERRLLAMKPIASRTTTLRAGALLAAGALALLAACEAKIPTSADVQNMDVTSAEKSAAGTLLLGDAGTVYYVDGVKTDAATAHAIAKDRIATIQVRKENGASEMRITTVANGATRAPGEGVHVMVTERQGGDTGAVIVHGSMDHGAHMSTMKFDGLILIDGKKADNAALQAIDPRSIVSMEVIKGPRAAQESTDPAAVNGIIRVTTKAGAAASK